MSRPYHREVFFAYNGPGPWACFFCGELVDFWTVYVHHRDEDKTNNDPANLVPCHRGCHSGYHTKKARQLRPWRPSPGQRVIQSQKMKAHKKTPEHLEKMRLGSQRAAARRFHCIECDRDFPGNLSTAHKNKTGHRFTDE